MKKRNDKLAIFSEAVLNEAKATADDIYEKTKEQKAQMLFAGKSDADIEIAAYKKTSIGNMKSELSLKRKEFNDKLLISEHEFCEAVTEKVLKQSGDSLREYAKSLEYKELLCRKCVETLCANDVSFTVFLSSDDMKYSIDVLKALSQSGDAGSRLVGIECDDSIKLGGVRFVSNDRKTAVDLTFDTALENQSEYLYSLIKKEITYTDCDILDY